MIRIFGDNNWEEAPGRDSEKIIIIDRKDIYNPDKKKVAFNLLKKYYEGKCHRNTYIKKIIEVIDIKYDSFTLVDHNNSGDFEAHVVFKAEVLEYKQGDIIVGARVISPGRGSEQVRLEKGPIGIGVSLNNNITQLLVNQLITLKVDVSIYDEGSNEIFIMGKLVPHTLVIPHVYKLTNDIENLRGVVDEYEKIIEKLVEKTNTFNKPLYNFMKEKMYPFMEDQSNKTYIKASYRKLFKELLDKKYDSPIVITPSLLLNQIDGFVYMDVGNYISEDNAEKIIKLLYNEHIKALRVLIDMCEDYTDYKNRNLKYLWEYYGNSKLNNKWLEEKGKITLKDIMTKAGVNVKNIIENKTNKIDKFVNDVLNKVIEFPYANKYMPSAEQMVENLNNHEPIIKRDKFVLQIYNKNRLFTPPIYKGNYVRILSKLENHDLFDGIIDLYNEKARIKSKRSYAKLSTYDGWKNKDHLAKIMKIAINNGFDINDPRELREAIYLSSPEPAYFKLSWLKGILDIVYGDYKEKKWLDISAGWGDELMLACINDMEYLSFDPNTDLKDGHNKIISDFGSDKQKVIYGPFEEGELKQDHYDFCLTSPPFFDIEIYSDNENQSLTKFPKLRDWMVGFLFKSLKKAWNAIKKNGHLMVHMGDPRKVAINEPMNLYIEQYLPNSSYQGVIGLEGSSGKVRPVWVWKKSDNIKWNNNVKDRLLGKLYPDYDIDEKNLFK